MHVHDNHGLKDEHLWPGNGTIDWPSTIEALKALETPPAIVLEISNKLDDSPIQTVGRIQEAYARFDEPSAS